MSNLDEALERFHLTDVEFAGGLANHGPMGAEALESLGHQALIPAFVDLYVPRLPMAEPGAVMSEDEADAALGKIERRSDWVATFEARLEGGDWRMVLSSALPDLMAGLFAGAGHGLLRTVHAARALEREDSPLRRRELARGLAYWSARYQRLPGLPGSRPRAGQTLASWWLDCPLLGLEEARSGFFFDTVKRLDDSPAFADAIDELVRPSQSEIDGYLVALCRTAAQLYLEHPDARVAYVHAVTIPSGLRDLVRYLDPHADPNAPGQAALHGAQAVAALHSVYGHRDGSGALAATPDVEVAETAKSWDEIRYRAACSIQEHAIKMAEACWRVDRSAPDPIFRRAAADAALRIEGAGAASAC